MIIEQIKDIKESELYRQADIRNNNEINCSKCGKLINYAYITTGEAICEKCYLETIDKEGK